MGFQRRTQLECLRLSSKVPQSHQPPVIAVSVRNRQFIACDLKWRTLPAISRLHLDKAFAAVRIETPYVVAGPIPIDVRDPSNATSQVGPSGSK